MEPPRGSDLPDQNLRDFRAPSGAGWALWGDVPNALAWVGIALIVGAGLAMLRRR